MGETASPSYLLGMDLGTTNIKAIILNVTFFI